MSTPGSTVDCTVRDFHGDNRCHRWQRAVLKVGSSLLAGRRRRADRRAMRWRSRDFVVAAARRGSAKWSSCRPARSPPGRAIACARRRRRRCARCAPGAGRARAGARDRRSGSGFFDAPGRAGAADPRRPAQPPPLPQCARHACANCCAAARCRWSTRTTPSRSTSSSSATTTTSPRSSPTLVDADLLLIATDIDGLYERRSAPRSRCARRSQSWRTLDADAAGRWPAAPAARRHRRHAHQARGRANARRAPASPPRCSTARAATCWQALARDRLRGTLRPRRAATGSPRASTGCDNAPLAPGRVADRRRRRARADRAGASLLPRRRGRRSRATSAAATWSRVRATSARRDPVARGVSAVRRRRNPPHRAPRTATTSRRRSGYSYGEKIVHRDDLVLLRRRDAPEVTAQVSALRPTSWRERATRSARRVWRALRCRDAAPR